MRAKFFVCSRMIIAMDGKVLMGKELLGNGAPMWETPGGGLRPAETLEECCRREAAEELGITVTVKNEIPRFRSTVEVQHTQYDPDTHWLMVYCVCDPIGVPDLSKASDPEFTEIRYLNRQGFYDLVQKGHVALLDQNFLPDILEELGVWIREDKSGN